MFVFLNLLCNSVLPLELVSVNTDFTRYVPLERPLLLLEKLIVLNSIIFELTTFHY